MRKPIHICILTTAHPTDDKRVFEKVAATFAKEQFCVSWVGPSKDNANLTLHWSLGIELHLTPALKGRIDRLLSPRRIARASKFVRNVDIYYVPDPDAVPIALRLTALSGAKVVFDIHEVYHDALLDRHLHGFRVPWIREFVRRKIVALCANCSIVMGVSNAVLNYYVVPGKPRLVVRSCATLRFADQPPDENLDDAHSFTLMHGLSSMKRGTEVLLRALAMLDSKSTDIHVVMFETFVDAADKQRFKNLLSELHIESQVDLRKTVPLNQMPSILRTCDAGLIGYGRDLGPDSLPNRFFEYMAAGIPIIAPSYSTEIAKIIRSEKCGLLVDMEKPSEVANAIQVLIHDRIESRAMGKRGRVAFEARHNWEKEVEPLLDHIHVWFQ